ncbi:MAG TPA: cytochrome c3 family protein, partial [bacterium]
AAGEANLLRTEQSALCLGCHTEPADLGSDYRNSPHHEIGCSACHSPHGSAEARLMQSDPISLCGTCHQHQHSVTHPLGAAVVDPRDGTPMSCGSCHQIHLAQHEPLLPKDGARELCVECHKNK